MVYGLSKSWGDTLKKLNIEEVKSRLDKVGLRLISEYISRKDKIIVEDKDGIQYSVFANKVFDGFKPRITSALNVKECFIKKANKIHHNKYSYDKVEYISDKYKVIITCPEHGDFMQIPSSHFVGSGCPKCGIEKIKINRPTNGFSRTSWIKYCISKGKKAKLYILKCISDNEVFVKIGITTRKIIGEADRGRYWKTNMPYKFELIKEIKGSPEYCYDKEKEIEKKFYHYKYKPQVYFNGFTECYVLDILNYLGKGVIP